MIPALLPNYARVDVAFERGEGAYLTSTDGRRYLDYAAGIAVDALGHAHPHLVETLTRQAGRLWHVSNLFRIPEQERYAERLVAATFADSVFFCNSGAEAVEAALKMARRYHFVNGRPERNRIITAEGAFHGRTFAALAAANNPNYLEGYAPALEGFDQVSFGNLNELRAAIGPETAAILVEPVQGEGGVRSADADFLRGIRAAADEFDLLVILDEVQSGFGRTGRLFAHEWAGIAPDILAAAKGIAGGFPCGAVLAVEKAAAALTPGTHGSTFGGNPLAMAVAGAVLDVMLADGFLAGVERIGGRMRAELEALAARYPTIIAEVRGFGLLLGLRLSETHRNTDFAGKAREFGLLLAPAAENVVRVVPPLIIGEAEVEDGIHILDRACRALA